MSRLTAQAWDFPFFGLNRVSFCGFFTFRDQYRDYIVKHLRKYISPPLRSSRTALEISSLSKFQRSRIEANSNAIDWAMGALFGFSMKRTSLIYVPVKGEHRTSLIVFRTSYIPGDITQHLLWLSILCRENTFVAISCSLWSMQTEPSWRLRAVNLFARSLCRALAWKNHVSNHQPAISCKHCLYCRCIVDRVKFETWSEIERPVEMTTTKHGSTIFSMTSSLASRISSSTHG